MNWFMLSTNPLSQYRPTELSVTTEVFGLVLSHMVATSHMRSSGTWDAASETEDWMFNFI